MVSWRLRPTRTAVIDERQPETAIKRVEARAEVGVVEAGPARQDDAPGPCPGQLVGKGSPVDVGDHQWPHPRARAR